MNGNRDIRNVIFVLQKIVDSGVPVDAEPTAFFVVTEEINEFYLDLTTCILIYRKQQPQNFVVGLAEQATIAGRVSTERADIRQAIQDSSFGDKTALVDQMMSGDIVAVILPLGRDT